MGANFREATRARSRNEFAAKINVSLMENEETSYWLKLLEESEIIPADRLAPLKAESNKIAAILVTIIKYQEC